MAFNLELKSYYLYMLLAVILVSRSLLRNNAIFIYSFLLIGLIIKPSGRS